jgi:hypothetical protein
MLRNPQKSPQLTVALLNSATWISIQVPEEPLKFFKTVWILPKRSLVSHNLSDLQSLFNFVQKFNNPPIHIRSYVTSLSQKMPVEIALVYEGTWRVSDGQGPTDLGDSEAQLGRCSVRPDWREERVAQVHSLRIGQSKPPGA